MTDPEWERWKETFHRAGRGSPPAVLKRAMTDRRRALFGVVGFYILVTAMLIHACVRLSKARGGTEVASIAFNVVLVLFLGVVMPLVMRGTWGVDGVPMLERIAALERRHAARRRLMHVLVGAMAGGVASNVALFTLDGDRTRIASMAVALAFAGAAFWRVNRVIERDLREAQEVRKILSGTDATVEDPDERGVGGSSGPRRW